MDKKDLRIVFMGTPDFAVASLKILVENDYNVVGVITMPEKASGRGYKLQHSPIKEYALEKNLPLLQPEKLRDENFLAELKSWNADLQIVVAFRMLPEVVWNMPRMGTFNLHGSLLPQYRGAAPINWAIINGEQETGVTTFFLVHDIDMGAIILQEKIKIAENDNVGYIHDQLMLVGAKLVQKTVDLVIENKAHSLPQANFIKEGAELNSAPKIFKETCKIDWSKNVEAIHNLIRGMSPYPAAWSELTNGEETIQPVKILASTIIYTESQKPVGSIDTDNKTYLHIACKGGMINVLKMQIPGKRAMDIEDLLRGYKVEESAKFV